MSKYEHQDFDHIIKKYNLGHKSNKYYLDIEKVVNLTYGKVQSTGVKNASDGNSYVAPFRTRLMAISTYDSGNHYVPIMYFIGILRQQGAIKSVVSEFLIIAKHLDETIYTSVPLYIDTKFVSNDEQIMDVLLQQAMNDDMKDKLLKYIDTSNKLHMKMGNIVRSMKSTEDKKMSYIYKHFKEVQHDVAPLDIELINDSDSLDDILAMLSSKVTSDVHARLQAPVAKHQLSMPGHVYLLKFTCPQQGIYFKIGHTTRELKNRVNEYNTKQKWQDTDVEYQLLRSKQVDDSKQIEDQLITHFNNNFTKF